MVVAWLLGWLLSGGWVAAGSPSAARGLPRQEAVARYGTAIWQARQARLLTAVAQLETSLDYQPAALAPRRELARLLEQLERQPAAVRHLQQVLAAQPDDLVAAEHLSRLLAELGAEDEIAPLARRVLLGANLPAAQWDEAVRLARRWAATADTAADKEAAWRRVLHWTFQQRDTALAAGTWTPRTVDTLAATAWCELALTLAQQDRWAQAQEAFSQAEVLLQRWNDTDGRHRLLQKRAEAAACRKQWSEAVRWQRQYLQHARPNDVQACRKYLLYLQQAGLAPEQQIAELQRLNAEGRQPALQAVLAVEMARLSSHRRQAEQLTERLLLEGVDDDVLRLLLHGWIVQGGGALVAGWLERLAAATKDQDGESDKMATLLERAQILCRALLAEPESATVWLQQMREAPCSAAAAFFLGHLAAKLGQWSVAEHFYRRAWLQAEPTGRDAAAIRLVEVLRQQHRWQALLEVCQHRLRTGPTAGQHVFLWHQALALVHLGQLLEAEGVAELAWQLTPAAEQTAACLQQARLLELAGRSWAALQVLEQAEKAAPTDRERQAAGNARAALLCRLGRHQAAQALWEQLLQRYPDQAVACRELALLLLAHPDGDLQRAERLARHARYVATWQRRLTRQYPLTDALATGTLGRVLLCQQRNAEAQRLLAVAVTLPEGKNDRRLWHWLAEAYERCGDPERAAQARQRCQQLPADPTTMPP